jgi:hypothetical protein
LKASIRAKVEHPFQVIKNLLRHKKVCHKGLAKNEARLFSLFDLTNLVIANRSLWNRHARGTSWRPERRQKDAKRQEGPLRSLRIEHLNSFRSTSRRVSLDMCSAAAKISMSWHSCGLTRFCKAD